MTCCYCGTRAALVLDRGRHELACSACGAPLHDLKMLPQSRMTDVTPAPAAPRRAKIAPPPDRPRKSKPPKRRKGFLHKVLEEAFDAIEDIFD